MWEIIPGLSVIIAERVVKPKVEDKAHHNYGFAANLCSDKPVWVKAVSVLLTLWTTVIFIISLTLAGSKMLKIGLSFLLGGAFSNTYDRVKRGYVVDYLRIPVGPKFIRKFIWNIGDFAIIIGALMVALGA